MPTEGPRPPRSGGPGPPPAADPGPTRPPGPRPSRLALALAAWRVPDHVADALVGDVEERWRRDLLPRRGRVLADLWLWWQALTVRRGALRRAARRLDAVRPSGSGPRWPSPRPWISSMSYGDLGYAVRRMLRSPGFTAVAILSLALGIGANTAVFSVVNAVLLRDLPVRAPEELVEVYTSDSGGYPYATSSHPDYVDLRDASADVFSGVVGSRTFIGRVEAEGRPRVVMGELVSWDYFQTLGVEMALGRAFVAEEEVPGGAARVAILGHRLWTSDFGADPSVLGRSLVLNGQPYTVVGVAPEDFTGSMPMLAAGVYAPLANTNHLMGSDSDQLASRGSRSMFLKARLRPGVTVEQADAALAAFAAGLSERYPDTNDERVMRALPSSSVALNPLVDGALLPVAGLLLAVVAVVLLIACANLASFLLARAEDRRREIAVRLALGAGRGRLVRQLLVETSLLGLLGGLGGLLVADWTVRLLVGFQPPIPLPLDLAVELDGTVLLFTAVVSLAAGLAFGLAPALQATRPDLAPTLKDAGGQQRPGRWNLRSLLVVAQVGFSFVLLIGAGLFVRSLTKARSIDPGFDTGPGAVIWPMDRLSGYETPEEQEALRRLLRERLLADPAITEVALTDRLPLGIEVRTSDYVLPGVPSDAPDGFHAIDDVRVGPAYFDVMGVEILRGRGLRETDLDGEPVAVVSEAFVRRYYPGGEVVGSVIERPGGAGVRIVGVARDTKVRTLGEAPRPYVYRSPAPGAFVGMQYVVRGPGGSAATLAAALRVVEEVDPDLALFEAKTMEEHLGLMLFPPRMAAFLLTVLGGLGLLLAAIGIYGVVSHAVSRRTRELGIRMSLGASARDLVAMSVGGAMRLVLVGGLVGVILAAALAWAVSGYLYGISGADVVTFVTIPLVLTGVALVAAYLPARSASAVDPVQALRAE